MDRIAEEAARRRTFAIISHPDAGKTTLTEKLLLYANAIHLAGSVKARKASRHALSDWMSIEKERGISIASSVLQFMHQGKALNLLDTPGHADFSEDTFRTLAAVDAAVMLIDHAKGVESRTLKLFEVCRMRELPVITFMNKLDREGLEPLALIDEVASTLKLKVAPLTWPIGMGRDFKGVIDVVTRKVSLFTAAHHGTRAIYAESVPWEEAQALLGNFWFEKLEHELDLLALAGDPYNDEEFLAGKLSPVFWGSAVNNFGIETLLAYLTTKSQAPTGRWLKPLKAAETVKESSRKVSEPLYLEPHDPRFSGFIFKIQANMDPKHRDRIAFMRVVSGRFVRGMEVFITRTGEILKLAKPHAFLAQERSIVEEAWPGDIVGLYDPGNLRIGDTLLGMKEELAFPGIPKFAPEYFCELLLQDPLRRKALDAGLTQLAHEGVIQLFYLLNAAKHFPYVGAIGMLQFEVLKERLQSEYNVQVKLQKLPYNHARWLGGSSEALNWLKARRDYILAEDNQGKLVLLAESLWVYRVAMENAPNLVLYEIEQI